MFDSLSIPPFSVSTAEGRPHHQTCGSGGGSCHYIFGWGEQVYFFYLNTLRGFETFLEWNAKRDKFWNSGRDKCCLRNTHSYTFVSLLQNLIGINCIKILHQNNFLFLSSWKRSRWRPSACSSNRTYWCKTWNRLWWKSMITTRPVRVYSSLCALKSLEGNAIEGFYYKPSKMILEYK